MEVVIIRHAIAEPRVEEGGTQPEDSLRELTPKGRRRMKRAARGLRVLVPRFDLLGTSPLVRAAQTAEIVARVFGDIEITTVPALKPGAGPEAVVSWLNEVESSGTVALEGHEPDLSGLATHLLSAQQQPFLSFGKGGAALLEVPAGVPPSGASLVWLATPRLLRRLDRRG
jgi:phosphohistidine phosphatase